MKIVQFFLPGKGKRVGLIQGDRMLDITSDAEGISSSLDLVVQGKTLEGLIARATWLTRRLHRRALDWRELQRAPSRRSAHMLVPIEAPEVWATGGSEGHPLTRLATDAPRGAPGSRVADNRRPALLFKGTAPRVVGPHAAVRIRADSALTVPQASLAAVLGPTGQVVAYTACNDVLARDIERQGPGCAGQARVYQGSCALGPCLVTPDEIEDPLALQVRCSIQRDGETIFCETANTRDFERSMEGVAAWLCRDNPVPPGTVLSASAGIEVSDDAALSDTDEVHIEIQAIGRLSNPVRRHAR